MAPTAEHAKLEKKWKNHKVDLTAAPIEDVVEFVKYKFIDFEYHNDMDEDLRAYFRRHFKTFTVDLFRRVSEVEE
ncbi:hypothetical protein B0O99DRAFT_629222, partial [Bisporella sp. PMI_857]